MNPGESYDPLLMSLVKSTNQCRWRGGDRLKKDVSALRQLRHRLSMCTFQRVSGQDNIFKWQFECVKNCNGAGFFTLNSFPSVLRTVHHPKDIQPIWHNRGVNMGQYPYGMLSTPCRVHDPTNWGCSEGKREGHLHIRKRFLMCCTLNVLQLRLIDWVCMV